MITDSDNARWRVGRSIGRTIYLDDQVVGMMDTAALAARVVEALNAYEPDPDDT